MRPPSPVSRARLVAVALALALAACEPTNQGYAPEQPVKYSHAVHAGGLRIPCQYCHYAAERGRHAGIPPAATCMTRCRVSPTGARAASRQRPCLS